MDLEKQAFDYEVKEELNVGEVIDIIATACEGGIGYWAKLWNGGKDWDAARERLIQSGEEDPLYCDVFWEVLRSGKRVKFTDTEVDRPGPEDTWYMTLNKLKKGCAMFAKEKGCTVKKALENGSFDAWDADSVFQYALFGELVYG